MNHRTIQVTQEHIDAGRTCNSSHCPVALAMLENGYAHSDVAPRFSYQRRPKTLSVYHSHGPRLTSWISNYDQGMRVYPITLILQPGKGPYPHLEVQA